MKTTLLTTVAVVGLALAVGWTALAHGPQGGMGQGFGPGFGHGGYGMMQQGGRHMGGYGQRGQGPDGAPCQTLQSGEKLDSATAKEMVEHRLERHGNTLLEVGKVVETDDGKIVVDVITKDGGKLANQYEFNADGRPHRWGR